MFITWGKTGRAWNCTIPPRVEPAKQKVAAIAERLRTREDGGLISIFYHPCEWVHQEFWDGVNFRRGANPPREDWKAPPQRLPEETEAAFRRFGEYIDYIRSLPDVRFVTASDLPVIYPDAIRTGGATGSDLAKLASRLVSNGTNGLDFQVLGNRAYSVADQFELLAGAVGRLIAGESLPSSIKAEGLLGPDGPPPSASGKTQYVEWRAFRDTTRDVVNFVETQKRVPARVFVGADAMPCRHGVFNRPGRSV